jgi:hypothetical protein
MTSSCAEGEARRTRESPIGNARALFVRAMLHLLNKTCENYDFIVCYFNLWWYSTLASLVFTKEGMEKASRGTETTLIDFISITSSGLFEASFTFYALILQFFFSTF